MSNNEAINNIRTQANIVDIIGSYINISKKGSNYFCICPFHDDHSPSMSISESKQIYKCFSCGAAGNVFTFVKEYENVTYQEAVSIVANKIGITYNNKFKVAENIKYKKEYDIYSLATKYYQNNLKTEIGKKALKYLKERGLNEEVIEEFKIGVSLNDKFALTNIFLNKKIPISDLEELGLISKYDGQAHDIFVNRIMFPIVNNEGFIVSYSARIYNNEETSKYINTKETKIFNKGSILYNLYNAKKHIKKANFVILVEGQMDAIRLSSVGIKNVVALMGSALTDKQINLLKKLNVPVYLSLDNDEAGQKATLTNGNLLNENQIETFVISFSDYKDPDEYIKNMGKDAYIRNIKNKKSFFEYKINNLKSKKNLNSTNELASYINEVLSYVVSENDEILKNLTINKLSTDYGIDKKILNEKLANLKPIKIKKITEEKVKHNDKKKLNKYEKAIDAIIYFMCSDPIYIKMYEKKLGYIPNKTYLSIINDILYFYEVNKYINIADFITFISLKNKNVDILNNIVANSNELVINENEMEGYIKIVKEDIKNKEIAELKKKLKNELDFDKKIALAEKITKIKKGSV